MPVFSQSFARYQCCGRACLASRAQWATNVPHHGVSSSCHHAFRLISQLRILLLCSLPAISRVPISRRAMASHASSEVVYSCLFLLGFNDGLMMVSVGCHHAQTAAAPVRRKSSPHAKRQPETPSKVSGCLFICTMVIRRYLKPCKIKFTATVLPIPKRQPENGRNEFQRS